MIDLLASVGNESPTDGLRFSFEVSFSEDVDAWEFDTYAGCIEMDVQEQPQSTCESMLDQFVLFSNEQKATVCLAIVSDSVGVDDMCGYITVSAHQAYTEFYQGLSESLGEWMYAKMQSDLDAMEDHTSETASA